METITQAARAKLNLGLWVGDKRPDKYHNLFSVLMPIDWMDTVTVRKSAAFKLWCNLQIDDNLVEKAWRIFQKEMNIASQVDIALEKKIPLQAGLGGGSSDAATALLLFDRLFKTPLTMEKLVMMGAQVGSDVPALMLNEPCLMTGRGEIAKPVEIRLNWGVVIVMPQATVSTKNAYEWLDEERKGRALPVQKEFNAWVEDESLLFEKMHNDFHDVVSRKVPQVKKAIEDLSNAGAQKVMLCGSGAAVAGFFRGANFLPLAKQCCDKIKNNYPISWMGRI